MNTFLCLLISLPIGANFEQPWKFWLWNGSTQVIEPEPRVSSNYVHPDLWMYPAEWEAKANLDALSDGVNNLQTWRDALSWGRVGGEELSGEQKWFDAAIADANARRAVWRHLWLAHVNGHSKHPIYGEDHDSNGDWDADNEFNEEYVVFFQRKQNVDMWMEVLEEEMTRDYGAPLGAMPSFTGVPMVIKR